MATMELFGTSYYKAIGRLFCNNILYWWEIKRCFHDFVSLSSSEKKHLAELETLYGS